MSNKTELTKLKEVLFRATIHYYIFKSNCSSTQVHKCTGINHNSSTINCNFTNVAKILIMIFVHKNAQAECCLILAKFILCLVHKSTIKGCDKFLY